MTGIILAGGRSYRMGTEKAFLEIDGTRIIDRTISLFKSIFDEVIIATNLPLLYLDFGVTVVTDFYKESGPLSGIYAGLFFASSNHVFICSCDMPFINVSFIEYMISHTDDYDILVPHTMEGYQPLHAIYGKKCLPLARKMLEQSKLKIDYLYKEYKELHILSIEEAVLEAFDPSKKMFINVNTQEDMKKILTLL